MVIYDMAMIPMYLFDLPEDIFLVLMDWTTRIFWTSDVYWSLTTGITLEDGSIQMNFKFIVSKYLRTWFPLDMLIVGSDWTEFLISTVSSGGGSGVVGMLPKYMRVVRITRLLR